MESRLLIAYTLIVLMIVVGVDAFITMRRKRRARRRMMRSSRWLSE